MRVMIVPSKELIELRKLFLLKGHDLWFVGGCVRDTLLDLEPKDIDLCTDATPDEALEIYKSTKRVSYFLTGIKHGTITVVLKPGHQLPVQTYEITSLRTESKHDGRHAIVAYTRDLKEDLSRRDLTINAMAQDFDGHIIDPFNGRNDLNKKIVRMVGDSTERFREDYLRILRFFRFHARFAGNSLIDYRATEAIANTKDGLKTISGERIWQEMQKIFVGPCVGIMINRMKIRGIMHAIQCARISPEYVLKCEIQEITDPAVVLGVSLKNSELEETMFRWKLSNKERARARFANKNKTNDNRESYKEQLVDGADESVTEQMLKYHELESLEDWDIPVFPVDGADIMRKGIVTGPAVGMTLRSLRQKWKDSNYTLTKEQLLTSSGF